MSAVPDQTSNGSLGDAVPPRGRVVRWLLYAASAGLVTLAAWRLSRDLSPLPDLNRLDALAARGDRAAAEQGYRELLRRSPGHGDARRSLARLLAQNGDMRGCADQLHLIPLWWPGKRADQFLEGQAYLGLNLAQPAESAWRAAVDDDPLHPLPAELLNGAARALVALYVLQERIPEAHAVLENVRRQSSPADQAGILVTRIRAETDRIQPREAAAILRRYVKADPRDLNSQLALARALNQLRQYDEADHVLSVLLADWPEAPQVHSLRVQLLDERGDFAGLEKAVAQLPESAATGNSRSLVLQARGMIAESRGDLATAESVFREAALLDPHDSQTQFRLARVLRRLEKVEEADQALARSQELRTARAEISEALAELAAAQRIGAAALKVAYDRLGSICEILGWSELAQAWRELARALPESTKAGAAMRPRPWAPDRIAVVGTLFRQ